MNISFFLSYLFAVLPAFPSPHLQPKTICINVFITSTHPVKKYTHTHKNNLTFEKVYTDEDHELKGVIYHVHKTIESFMDDNFGSLDVREGVWEDPVFYIFNKE